MASKNSRPSTDKSESAAQDRSRSHFSEPPDNSPDLQATLANAEDTLKLLSGWLVNLQAMARLEFSRTLGAGKRVVALQIVLIPLALLFYLSLCSGIGLAGYYFSQSIYVGFAAFVAIQAIVIGVIAVYQKKLRALLGFSQTKQQVQQVREALNDVFETTD